MQDETKRFGRRVARWSPQLAIALGGFAIVLCVLVTAPVAYWLGELVVGLVAGLFAVKLYQTGDGMYVIPYGLVLSLSTVVAMTTLPAMAVAPILGGVFTLMTGITCTIALRRQSVLELTNGDAH